MNERLERINTMLQILVDSIDEYNDRNAAIYEVALRVDELMAPDTAIADSVESPNIRYVNHVECVAVSLGSPVLTHGTVGFSNDDDMHFGIDIPKDDLSEWSVGSRFQVVMLEAPYEG